jgi:hypothetical protein
MEVLLIDIGALAVFLAYVAIVYWHAVSDGAPKGRRTGAARAAPVPVSPDLELLHEHDLARARPAVTAR